MNSINRADLSSTLIHFTKGKSEEEAFENLFSIIINECILASTKQNVVCFTETPFDIICKYGFVNYTDFTNYNKFGLMFYKKDIYKFYDGRPVLYLEKKHFNILLNDLKWRHTLFEPSFKYDEFNKKGFVDFSWEREWRVKDDLCFNEYEIEYKIIVPNKDYKNKLDERLNSYFEHKFNECYEENPRYIYLREYDYFEKEIVEREIENEDNCECDKYDIDGKIFDIILIEKDVN